MVFIASLDFATASFTGEDGWKAHRNTRIQRLAWEGRESGTRTERFDVQDEARSIRSAQRSEDLEMKT
ncbi:MAG: hypothetical protein WBG92_19550, partial [Thiohalocapsa sp.]